jgi:Protein of unknown function (DUF2853)
VADELNYADDVARYAAEVDEAAVAGIVKHLGIALRSKDASLVSCSDKTELERVRDSWCLKKLGLTDETAALDAAIGDVCATMKDDRNKARVTFYYLLAEKYGKLAELH